MEAWRSPPSATASPGCGRGCTGGCRLRPDLDLYTLFRAHRVAHPHRTTVIDALERRKHPERLLLVGDELPLALTGKRDRTALRARLAAELPTDHEQVG
ncbi:hypothetical protein ACH4VR_25790 [Streptomyces sp. NPDC020883]|uniref:hypothetical protein n=1 Tax=Streptomyces sp. NPDC020883 TaxID=3365099 RepID=UPI003794B181